MELLLIALVVVMALDFAALRWGFDSRDWIDSREWEHRSSTFFPTHHY